MSVTFLTNEDKAVIDKQLEDLSKGKVSSSGYAANKFLGTDGDGNIVEKDVPTGGDGGITVETDPTVPDWAKKSTKPTYTASEVGADPAGASSSAVGTHNTSESAHNDIRNLISGLTTRLNTLANSDDTTLDQLSEIVTYIKNNKSLIDGITTGKVSVSDIVNNLTTNSTNKPLSAAQGVALKALIDAIAVPTKVSQLTNDEGYITGYTETDPTVPAWAKSADKPSYTKSEVGLSNVQNVRQYSASNPPPYPVTSVAGKTGAVTLGKLNITGAATGSYDGSGNVTINVPTIAGEPGEDGHTPVKGVDYYTEADKAEFSEYIASELAKRGQLKPEFANSVEECTDTSKLYVLPDGYIYAHVTKEVATPGGTVPNFTNLLDDASAVVKPNYRYSASSATWKDYAGTSYIVPIPKGNVTIRVKNFYASGYSYMYASADGNTFRDVSVTFKDVNGGANPIDTVGVATYNNTSDSFVTFCCASGYVEIVTANEEITYTETTGGTEYITDWASTGHAFVPADYEDRIINVEDGLADAEANIAELQETFGNISSSANLTTAFSSPAYCPTPQLPADGSEGSDFNCNSVTTQDAYDYMDALCGKYTNYIYKQTMGKDASDTFDHNRYILSKAYWRAWQKENYPRMFAWQNGSTVIYSASVSPRVGDSMYSTPYIGTVYSTVTAVNSAAQTASTRTVNGLVFTRYADGDVEPTVVYTDVPVGPAIYHVEKVYNSSFTQITTVDTLGAGYIVGADGVTYTRYPFEDRRVDKSKPLSVFVLANEHGLLGDSLTPSFALMRMAKDLCRNTENPFLKWLKENCMITMIPVGNPWGYARYLEKASGYYNSNGININRNYDTPGWSTSDTNYGDVETFGAYPGSEIETQHIMDTIQLCKAAVGMSMHGLGVDPSSEMAQQPDNGYFIHQGCGYDPTRVKKIAEALYSAYNLGMDSDTAQSNSDMNAAKSPSYIQYAGAVGGLTETISWEAGTANNYNAIAMEQAYSQLLLFLQNWCEEAMLKAAE